MTRDSLTHRVAELLSGARHYPATLSEREALLNVRPHGQGILTEAGALAPPPLTDARPSAGEPDGTRGEREFDRAGDSTG